MTTRRNFIATASKGLLGASALPAFGPIRPGLGRTASGTGLVYDRRYLDHVLPERAGEAHPESPLRLVRMMEVFA
ncbi:MAG: hypothetical protein HOD00_13805, partial [Gemmatimonadales bacterium]|nr:hypothetical protein [Gemmatimonadales bacterium]